MQKGLLIYIFLFVIFAFILTYWFTVTCQSIHLRFMQHAIALAEKAKFHAPPNPWVGCIVVKNDEIIGKGFTQPPGHPHAEICALREAGQQAHGASLYVTLEPCVHTGRTPPCVDALIQSGISKVYIGIQDPDPRVQGKGVHLLQQAGVKVEQGICAKEIETQLTPYLFQRQKSIPYTLLKTAISLDGRTAAEDFSSQWITSDLARQDVHLQRASSQAVVIGAGTALKDIPRLTARHPLHHPLNPPLRVILDAHGKVPAQGPLFDQQLAPTLVVTTSNAPKERIEEWRSTGVEVATVSLSSQGVNLQETWEILGKKSILQVLVEGGATLHTSLLEARLVNRLLVYIGPLLLGPTGHPFYQKNISTLQEAQRLSLKEIHQLGDCVRLDYEPIPM